MLGRALWTSRLWKRRGTPVVVECDRVEDALPYAYWIEKQPVRLVLPVECLRMQGAFRYDDTHPFVAALRDGPERLTAFYRDVAPGSLAEMYGVARTGRKGEDLPPWELPWLMRARRAAPPGERGLGPEHGVSFYGPATPRKVAVEGERLRKVVAAIQSEGYDPDRFRDIEGHLMTDGRETCFFVRGGKHRTAALVHLGYTRIPVQIRRSWPPIVDARSAEQWPLVANGDIDRSLAVDILDRYIRGGCERA